jgi:hypothetical protein
MSLICDLVSKGVRIMPAAKKKVAKKAAIKKVAKRKSTMRFK